MLSCGWTWPNSVPSHPSVHVVHDIAWWVTGQSVGHARPQLTIRFTTYTLREGSLSVRATPIASQAVTPSFSSAELGGQGGGIFFLFAPSSLFVQLSAYQLSCPFFGVFFFNTEFLFLRRVSLNPCFCSVAFDDSSLVSLAVRPLLHGVASCSTPAHSYAEHHTSVFYAFYVSLLFFAQVTRIKILLLVSHVLLVTYEHEFDLGSGSTVTSQTGVCLWPVTKLFLLKTTQIYSCDLRVRVDV